MATNRVQIKDTHRRRWERRRIQKRLSLRALAERLELDEGTVRRWMNGSTQSMRRADYDRLMGELG